MRVTAFALALAAAIIGSCGTGARETEPIVFATFAEQEQQLENIGLLIESINAFGGSCSTAPVWVYVPGELVEARPPQLARLDSLGAVIKTSAAPDDALWLFFARKVFASALAEREAEGKAGVLAWLDDDTIVLREPGEFLLPPGKSLGYRPVMHKNIGTFYSEPVDSFWAIAFDRMSVESSSLFPMVTIADGDTIRPYFNAGCMVVRPERGVLRSWARCFPLLYGDPDLARMCREDVRKRIFIHQAALAGAVLNTVPRCEMLEFSENINYPIFFREMFGANRDFDDITGVVTLRHESFFRDPMPGWKEKLKGPADRTAWLREKLERAHTR